MQKLSICIPAYNYAQYLGYTIQSCLDVDFDFELVILDNCSSDATPELRLGFEKDKRVKWFRNEEVLPVQQNWNKAVSLTSGKYVKLLQADDYLLPGFFKIFSESIDMHNDCAIFGHLAIIIDENGNEIRKQARYGKSHTYFTSGDQALKLKLRNIARFKEPSCNFFLKDAWAAVGGYREDLRFTFDIAFNIDLVYKFGGELINEYGAAVRRHAKSDGAQLPSSMAVSELEKLVIEIWKILGNNISSSDKRAGNSLLQYRTLELFLQKVKRSPAESTKFLISNLKLFRNLSAIPFSLETLFRKLIYGDVQNSFENYDKN